MSTSRLLSTSHHHETYFYWCNDVDVMRRFYTEILGLEETFFQNDTERGWYSCLGQNLQLVCVRAGIPLPTATNEEFDLPNWSIQLSLERFRQALMRLAKAGIKPILTDGEQIRVIDPMGTPVDIQAVA